MSRLSGLEPVLETEAAEAEVTAEVRVRRSTGLGNDRVCLETARPAGGAGLAERSGRAALLTVCPASFKIAQITSRRGY